MVNGRRFFTRHLFLQTVMYCLAMLITAGAQASVTASVDRTELSSEETLTLSVRVNNKTSATTPDLSSLERDFHILGRSQNSRRIISNNGNESWIEWNITLMPKRTGDLTIPALEVDGQQTAPIGISVSRQTPAPDGALQPVFLRSSISSDHIYVQQQLLLTVQIFHAVQLDDLHITEPEFDNAVVRKVSQTSYQRVIKGSRYKVHELSYAIFPQQAGELTIPELVFSAMQPLGPRGYMLMPGQGQAIRKLTEQYQVTVASPPAGAAQPWLPAQDLSLEQTWSQDPSQAKVGESITRTITVRAKGLLDSQLPEFNFESVDGLKLYPDAGQSETLDNNDGVSSSKTFSLAIIPTRPGDMTLNALSIRWWDTENQTTREAVLPAVTLHVEGSPATNTPAEPQNQTPAVVTAGKPETAAQPLFWQLLSLVLAVLLIILAVAYWRLFKQVKRLNQQPSAEKTMACAVANDEKKSLKNLVDACENGDLLSIRSALINWAKYQWPAQEIATLQDVSMLANHQQLQAAIKQLNQALYSAEPQPDSVNRQQLLAAIHDLRLSPGKSGHHNQQTLPPLYSV